DRLERALAPALVYIIATEPMHDVGGMRQGYHPPVREQECRPPIPSPPVRHPRRHAAAIVARLWNRPRSPARPAACCWPPISRPLARPVKRDRMPVAIRRRPTVPPARGAGRTWERPPLGRQS